MQYQNPKIDNELNVVRQHPLKTFLKLLAMATALAVVIIVFLNLSTQFLVKYIPFEYETALADRLDITKVEPSKEQAYLQDLADRIIDQADVSANMRIQLHYSKQDTVNAFATLGGNVYFFKGLVEKLKSEQALAMVMAHEIAHIVNRDPIIALGRGLSTAITLSAIFGSSDNALIRRFIGSGETLTSLKYSRDHETRADGHGYQWINKLYGHGCGAEELFALFERLHTDDDSKLTQIFVTHPYASKRLQRIRENQADTCDENDSRITPNPLYND